MAASGASTSSLLSGWLSLLGNRLLLALLAVSLIPLALILGDITEDLATRFGDTIGGAAGGGLPSRSGGRWPWGRRIGRRSIGSIRLRTSA